MDEIDEDVAQFAQFGQKAGRFLNGVLKGGYLVLQFLILAWRDQTNHDHPCLRLVGLAHQPSRAGARELRSEAALGAMCQAIAARIDVGPTAIGALNVAANA